MGKIYKCLVLALAMLIGIAANAQRISDSGYSTVAYVKSDGTIQNSSYLTVGHIRDDGRILDKNYLTIGHIKRDGTIQDKNYLTVGRVKSDGTVQDKNYRTLGRVKDDGTVQDAVLKNPNANPRDRAKAQIERIEDARKFYVAISRAKKRLCISYSRYGIFGRPVGVTPFINSIKQHFYFFKK